MSHYIDLNQISYKEIKREVGSSGIEEIQSLLRWLRIRLPNREWEGRIAPSIISRSECELFGLSMPRFAFRLYLDSNHASFINIRRLGTMCAQSRAWGRRRPDSAQWRQIPFIQEVQPRGHPAWVLRKNVCIADCLLQMPEQVLRFNSDGTAKDITTDRLHVLTTHLGGAYGEREGVRGTPFARNMPLVGLCAQAACFMATALVHEHATGVFGIAEITALAKQGSENELLLTGLTPAAMARYFRHKTVGLGAIWQQAVPLNSDIGIVFRQVLRAYLMSGFPIILSVDAGRMAGEVNNNCPLQYPPGIYKTNGIQNIKHSGWLWKKPRAKPVTLRNHAIVLIGCATTDGQEFLFNDPGLYPFMIASSVSQFVDAACYKDKVTARTITEPMFLPVTPGRVSVPLLDWFKDGLIENNNRQPGLLQMALLIQTYRADRNFPRQPTPFTVGELRLRKVKDLNSELLVSNCVLRQGKVLEYRDVLLRKGLHDNWCWIQFTDWGIWVWDAERDAPTWEITPDKAFRYLLFMVGNGDRSWINENITVKKSQETINLSASDPDSAKAAAPIPKVEIALISSFSVKGFRDSIENWPDRPRHCELYCFMQNDAMALFPKSAMSLCYQFRQILRYSAKAYIMNIVRSIPIRISRNGIWLERRFSLPIRWPFVTALYQMSSSADSNRVVDRIAGHLARIAGEKDVNIVGLASFLPEISSSEENTRRSGRRGVQFLIKLADRLNKAYDHCIQVIELVGGSRVDGLWSAKSNEPQLQEKPLYVANCRSIEEVIGNIVNTIDGVGDEASSANLKLALELEPGPLYGIGSWEAVKHFCTRIDEPCGTKGTLAKRDGRCVIGLNLDIAHWMFHAGISVEILNAERSVAEKIMHSHISDHGKGHFADSRIGANHDIDDFRSWLWFLSKLMADGGSFDGYLSLELEACKSKEEINQSVKNLRLLQEKI